MNNNLENRQNYPTKNIETKNNPEELVQKISSILENLKKIGDLQNIKKITEISDKINFLLQNKQNIPTAIYSFINSIAEMQKINRMSEEKIKKIFA